MLMRRSLRAAASAWFSGGLSFDCTMCGKCCRRPEKPVLVNACEAEDMAQHLGMDVRRFSEEYLTDGTYAFGDVANKLLLKRGADGKSCVFLGPDNRCRVHKAKPIHCRTYPFHPDHLISEFDWNAEAANCEGMVPVRILPDSEKQNGKMEEGVVSRADIVKNLFMAELNRDEMPNESFASLSDMVAGMPEDALDEFASDYVAENWRKILYEDNKHFVVASQFCGEESERRALIFKATPTYVQTEIPHFPEGDKRRHDVIELLQPPHQAMALSLYLWLKWKKPNQVSDNVTAKDHHDPPVCRVAVLGAGCGALPNALLDMDVELTPHVDAVEIDPDVLKIGKEWFDFDGNRSPRLTIHCQDGLEFMNSSKREFYNVILIDVASVSLKRGTLIAPPLDFYSEGFLNDLRGSMSDLGIVAINVIGGMEKLVEVFEAFEQGFDQTWALCLPSQTVVFAAKGEIEDFVGTLGNLVHEKESFICDVARGTVADIETYTSKGKALVGWCGKDAIDEYKQTPK